MIQYRTKISNESKSSTFFRKITNNSKKLETYNTTDLFCIDDERNNLFLIIEYLTLIGQIYDYKDLLFLYVNEKKSVNMPIIYNMFQDLDYIIVNPSNNLDDKNYMKNNNVKILLENFNDSSYIKINKLNNKNKKIIAFFNIDYDDDFFKKQELWCNQLNVFSYFIKLKLLKNDDFEFLKGDKYISIYNNPKEYELNLIHIKENEKEEFEKEKYNTMELKEQLNYFHQIKQNNKYIYQDSDLLKYNLIGYDDSYDSVCEYYIIYNYILKNNKKNDINDLIMNILYKINKYYVDVLQISLVSCILKNEIDKDELNHLKIEEIFLEYIQIIYSLKNQVNSFKKENFILKNKYNEQIEFVKEIIDKLNFYIKKILEKNIVKKSKNYFFLNKIVNENEYYLKFFITTYEKDINQLNDNINLFKKTKNTKEYSTLSQIFITNLYRTIELIKEEYPINKVIVDKKDYFFL